MTRKYVILAIAMILALWSCKKQLAEYSFEGKHIAAPANRIVRIAPFKRTQPLPLISGYPDSTLITANLISRDLPSVGTVHFFLDLRILDMIRLSDTEICAHMTLGDYRKPGFYIEVDDIPAAYPLHLDLYAVFYGQYFYKRWIDYTNDWPDTVSLAFEVAYTFEH